MPLTLGIKIISPTYDVINCSEFKISINAEINNIKILDVKSLLFLGRAHHKYNVITIQGKLC